MDNMLGNGTSQKEVSELLKSIIERLFGSDGEYWAEVYKKTNRKENPFDKITVVDTYRREVKTMEKFYKKVFNETHDFSGVYIPPKPKGNWWLIIVAQGMKPQRLFEKCQEKFGTWKWTNENLDKIVTSDRMADDGHYAIWVRANVEADPHFKNLSANQLKDMNHKGITLEERLILELFYWWKTKKHLDINNWTLCSGSRYSDGRVPVVLFVQRAGGVRVDWYYPDNAHPHLHSREIVS